jgi:signal transduction histidine kinase/DNA-binding response OmpR family regulator
LVPPTAPKPAPEDKGGNRAGPPAASSPPARGPNTHFTLRRKLTASLMSVGLASLCVAALTYVACDLWSLRATLNARSQWLCDAVAQRWLTMSGDLARDTSWTRELVSDDTAREARLFDAHGELVATYLPEGSQAEPPARWLHPGARRDVYRGGQTLGAIEVTASAAPILARLRVHGSLFLVLAGVSALITLALGRRIHHRFSDQLLDLAHAANAISKRKDYSIRAVRRSDDEIGILVDTFNHMITQIELRDLQLKAEVKRAEAARVAKSQFLATMSHEIRTPINGVLGMTQLLLDTSLNSEQTEFARTIHKSAEGLLSVINDILDFSKGEAGRYEIERIPFAPAKVVHECLDTVSIVAAEKKLELCIETDERLPATLLGDPSRLRQVLLNLLSNALKFTAKGEIVLRVQLEDEQPGSARIRFEVQDTGIGIPQDRIDRLFQSFSQVDASRTRKYGGTGLGLAISKQIVEAMGGTMFVKTEEGVGSTFGFKLQLAIESAPEEPELVPPPRSLRVLVADPSPTSAAALAKMLSEDNFVEQANDGPGARMLLLEAANAQRPFDLMVVDLRLIGAFDALEAIGAQNLGAAPMVVLAPVNQLSAAADCKWTGRRAALAKPVKRSELFWCIAELQRGPLPSRSEAGTEARAEPAPRPDVCVLVAEDHPVNQRITTRFLDKLGIAHEVVSNGEEALAALKRRDFDLVLMDVQMPVMDGLEATLAIRKFEGLRGTHVPIVALTANVLEEHRKEAQQAGFDDYLAKPVKLEELRAKLQKWVREKAIA